MAADQQQFIIRNGLAREFGGSRLPLYLARQAMH
jgi:hypothetical protein